MSSFKELSKIDDRAKLKVYGWIREAEKELALDFVPMITNIIILYVNIDEYFDIISDDAQLSNNKQCLTKIEKGLLSASGNCNYGKIVIASQSDAVCQWNIKIHKIKTIFRIGISSSSSPNQTMYQQRDEHHYVFYNDTWTYDHSTNSFAPRSSVPSFGEGDVVSIHLDLKDENGQLSIEVNDGIKYNVYSKIMKGEDISYRLMFIPKSVDDSVEIMHFENI